MYTIWFGMRKFETESPTMLVADMVKLSDSSPNNLVYQDKFGAGPDPCFGHGERIDVTGEPHFYCVPAATMYRGSPQ